MAEEIGTEADATVTGAEAAETATEAMIAEDFVTGIEATTAATEVHSRRLTQPFLPKNPSERPPCLTSSLRRSEAGTKSR